MPAAENLNHPTGSGAARRALVRRALAALLGAAVLFTAACQPKGVGPAARPAKPAVVDATGRFRAESIGTPFEGKPWISHVNVVDLDRDGLPDILACDDKLQAVVWLR